MYEMGGCKCERLTAGLSDGLRQGFPAHVICDQQDLVNQMNDAISDFDVRLQNLGILHHHRA